MNEHSRVQAKDLMKEFGIKVLGGEVAHTVGEAVEAQNLTLVFGLWLDSYGRSGKAGGVKVAKSLEEVKEHASNILGKVLVTHQTGPEGKEVKKLLIEEGCDIDHEYYVGLVLDRGTGKVVFMASSEGGVEIEKVAEETPEKIHKVFIDPAVGYTSYGEGLGCHGYEGDVLKNVQVFGGFPISIESDCTVQINPL